MKKPMIAATAAVLLLTATACGGQHADATPAKHGKTHKVACHRITAKAHIEGTDQYLLTLKGVKQPVLVPKPAFEAADVGSKYCTG